MIKQNMILFFFFGLSISVIAQPLNKPTAEKMLSTAERLEAEKDYINALEWYEKAYEVSEDRDLLYKIALMAYQIRDYRKTERRLASFLRRDKGNYPDAKYLYGKVQKMNGNHLEAIATLKEFIIETADPKLKRLAQIELAGAEMARDLPPNPKVTIAHSGKNLNTRQGQYSAVLVGGNEVYFSGFDTDDVIEGSQEDLGVYAKIYKSSRKENIWEKPTPLDQRINRENFHNSYVYVTSNGNKMFFTRAILEGSSILESKIFVALKGRDGWEGAEEVKGVNGNWIAKHPVVGELFGREVLFFVSDKDGGKGGFDIYYANLNADGSYADPINLGDAINTEGNEETPFYKDGMLYFSTDGRPSLGGYDVYSSEWNGTNWSSPLNMGRGINSELDDLYFTLDEEGYKGMLISNRGENRSPTGFGATCCNDIFEFEIAKIAADLIVGTFSDDKKPLLGAAVTVSEIIAAREENPYSQTNKEGNVFPFPLGIEKSYKIIATHPGYFPDSIEINTVGLKESKSFEHRFYLKQLPPPPAPEPEFDTIDIDEPIELSNIYYDFDDDVILKQAEQDLELILELMNEYPEMKIELRSHTDARGNDAYNKQLSQARAESARRWLMRRGIARERILAVGYGETEPKTITAKVANNYPFLKEGDVLTESFINALSNSEQQEIAHQLNRRTEFKILEGPTSIRVKSTRLKKNREDVKPTTPTTTPRSRQRGPNMPEMELEQQNPITIHRLSSLYGKKDLKGVPIMQFDKRIIDFGEVKKGEKRIHTYKFTNVGDTILKIDAVDHCDCTTAEYPRRVISPGQSAEIKITFDSKDKEESETISINILLEQVDPENNIPIIEELQYKFKLVK